ncbi:hypothetical protein B0H63DRAFT_546814 [Podospora didyma]|uniref:Peptidase A1 domain-containing protein n=1 Tax=Podospora didyma TaxID=330526 RepID=A0AAE0KIK6_9PEZI|nr:hypothetical protein B0H63DRAFT_546814 [Podospora didyma]
MVDFGYDDWYGVAPYGGDLTITLDTGLSVRNTNDRLIVPSSNIDHKTGQRFVDDADPTLLIDPGPTQPAAGKALLERHYAIVNEERNQFSLAIANPTADTNLVAFDSEGIETQDICSLGTSNLLPSPPSETSSAPTSTAGGTESVSVSGPALSVGVIATIVVSVVVALATGVVGHMFDTTKGKTTALNPEPVPLSPQAQTYSKPELPSSPTLFHPAFVNYDAFSTMGGGEAGELGNTSAPSELPTRGLSRARGPHFELSPS